MVSLNAGIMPMALLCAALGLALSTADRRSAALAVLALAAAAIAIALVPFDPALGKTIFAGLLLSTIGTAGLVHRRVGMPRGWAIALAINDGAWLGAAASISSLRHDLAAALPLALLFVPGGWFVRRGYGIVVKVVSSWLLAVAVLAIFVSLVPTPGYEPDHME